MEGDKLIQDIKEFRAKHEGKCLSTTHHLTEKDFFAINSELPKYFSRFTLEMAYGKYKLNIPM